MSTVSDCLRSSTTADADTCEVWGFFGRDSLKRLNFFYVTIETSTLNNNLIILTKTKINDGNLVAGQQRILLDWR